MSALPGHLYIIATPIGNLRDITLRARDTLASVDLIACEDTRHSGVLLQHLEIRKPLISLHQHNEAMRTAGFLTDLREGKSIAYISDAGMPGVSDPGARLVAACRQADLPVEVLPGPSAVLTAMVGSGFPADAFYFGGFLPVKSGQRERALTAALEADETSIYFESPHRLPTTLDLLRRLRPDRLICVARELTKKFEEYRRGTAMEVAAHYEAHPAKGEICLLISGLALPKWAGSAPAPESAE
ncbi:MAG: 16S rRNA (cytidine(1402)-2'-O)-methyltransferase [Verrucomicrobiaceae bacterium]|nr:MAG: 16S rRNA (cytidine(1402)-2'-O)-methyltransferase [Verrucomicrobiaceae bacterium]